jgi:hypothetical protein
MRFSISEQYFGFTPMTSHRETCSRSGTNLWEVSRIHRERLRSQETGGPYTETAIRMVCTECGVVHLDHGENWGTQGTTTREIGYGAKPIRCAGLWLHPGPIYPYRDDTDPETYYATGSPERPTEPRDVIGIIGWYRPFNGSRHGAVRWWAGIGLTELGNARTTAPDDLVLKSKTAAARWVADQHAEHLAAAADAANVAEAAHAAPGTVRS